MAASTHVARSSVKIKPETKAPSVGVSKAERAVPMRAQCGAKTIQMFRSEPSEELLPQTVFGVTAAVTQEWRGERRESLAEERWAAEGSSAVVATVDHAPLCGCARRVTWGETWARMPIS
ncbi:unnamed protein product [Arctogadus glacialis]